ncbi:MAG: hypothetical protein ACI33S_05885 [Bacilli bacterium]
MLDLVNLLDYGDMTSICDDLSPLLRIVGIALKLIQYAVPIMLIVIGSIDFAKATTEKDEKAIKDAQNKFMKRGIMALIVFLIVPIVSVLMTLVSGEGYKDCMECISSPFGSECKALVKSAE